MQSNISGHAHIGDDSGSVVVYKITGVDTTVYSHKDQIDRLEKALAAKDAADDQH